MHASQGKLEPTNAAVMKTGRFSLGVEEEYQIVNRESGELKASGEALVHEVQEEVGEAAQHELFLSQIEIGTPVCNGLAEVRREITRLRHAVIEAAREAGDEILSAGTHPFSAPTHQPFTPKPRYTGMAYNYQHLAHEHFICGCHVHVGINDRELTIEIMNRARGWLAPLVALAANSPFWLGEETGYASYRTEVWRRWPMAGSPHIFRNRAEYDALVRTLVQTGGVEDETRIYWDMRPADRFETLEFRATDVCLTIDEAVMIAGLCGALARTCAADAARDAEREAVYVGVRPELLRAAEWRAARYGLDETLIDVHAGQAVPAKDLVHQLLAYLRPALEENGEWDEISHLVNEVLERGNGAARQRAAFEKKGDLTDVVQYIAAETARGVVA